MGESHCVRMVSMISSILHLFIWCCRAFLKSFGHMVSIDYESHKLYDWSLGAEWLDWTPLYNRGHRYASERQWTTPTTFKPLMCMFNPVIDMTENSTPGQQVPERSEGHFLLDLVMLHFILSFSARIFEQRVIIATVSAYIFIYT